MTNRLEPSEFSELSSETTWNRLSRYNYNNNGMLHDGPSLCYLIYVFILMLLFDFLGPWTTEIYTPSLIEMKDIFNTTEFNIQLTIILFTFSHSISQILFTFLHEYYNYSKLIFLSITIYVISSVMCSLSASNKWSIITFIIFRTIQGIGSGFAIMISNEIAFSFSFIIKNYIETSRKNKIINKYKNNTENGYNTIPKPKDTMSEQIRKLNGQPLPIKNKNNKHFDSPGGNGTNLTIDSSNIDAFNYNILYESDGNIRKKQTSNNNTNNGNDVHFIDALVLLILSCIRAFIGIASAAPVGAIITYYLEFSTIFYVLCAIGIITGLVMFPLFTSNIFRPNTTNNNDDNSLIYPSILGGIKQNDNNNKQDILYNAKKRKNFINKLNTSLARQTISKTQKTQRTDNIHISRSYRYFSMDGQNSLLWNIDKDDTYLDKGKRKKNNTELSVEEKAGNFDQFSPNSHDDLNNTMTSDHSNMSHLRIPNTNFDKQSSILSSMIIDNADAATSNNIINVDVSFWSQLIKYGVIIISSPISLLLLIMFCVGYTGILLMLCEISFILRDDENENLNFSIILTGIFIGIMVLSLMFGSAITNYITEKFFDYIKQIRIKKTRKDSNDNKCKYCCCFDIKNFMWILVGFICLLFGVISFVAIYPVIKNNYELFGENNLLIPKNDEQPIPNIYIYSVVIFYIFLFGCLIPPLMSILYINSGSFIQCPSILKSLIIHFWRNLFACIIVTIILKYRENVDRFHPNFLHIYISICSILLFLIYFIIILPYKFCVEPYKQQLRLKSSLSDHDTTINDDIGSLTNILNNTNQSNKLNKIILDFVETNANKDNINDSPNNKPRNGDDNRSSFDVLSSDNQNGATHSNFTSKSSVASIDSDTLPNSSNNNSNNDNITVLTS